MTAYSRGESAICDTIYGELSLGDLCNSNYDVARAHSTCIQIKSNVDQQGQVYQHKQSKPFASKQVPRRDTRISLIQTRLSASTQREPHQMQANNIHETTPVVNQPTATYQLIADRSRDIDRFNCTNYCQYSVRQNSL